MHDDIDDEDDLGALYDQTGNLRDTPTPRIGSNSGMEEDDALDGLELDDLMKEARKDLFKDLLKGLRQGILTPSEKNVLRQMLKDNGMVLGDPNDGAEEGPKRPKADLPTFGDPDYARR